MPIVVHVHSVKHLPLIYRERGWDFLTIIEEGRGSRLSCKNVGFVYRSVKNSFWYLRLLYFKSTINLVLLIKVFHTKKHVMLFCSFLNIKITLLRISLFLYLNLLGCCCQKMSKMGDSEKKCCPFSRCL